MTNAKDVLISGIEIASFLLAAFGGFLTDIAPPDEVNASFAVGMASVLVLIVLLLVSAIGRRAPGHRYRLRWIGAGVGFLLVSLPAAYLYWDALESRTFLSPLDEKNERRVQASPEYLTKDALDWIKRNPNRQSAVELVKNLPYDEIWRAEGITRSKELLTWTYCWLVLAIATAIFCLIEANSPPLQRARQR